MYFTKGSIAVLKRCIRNNVMSSLEYARQAYAQPLRDAGLPGISRLNAAILDNRMILAP